MDTIDQMMIEVHSRPYKLELLDEFVCALPDHGVVDLPSTTTVDEVTNLLCALTRNGFTAEFQAPRTTEHLANGRVYLLSRTYHITYDRIPGFPHYRKEEETTQ